MTPEDRAAFVEAFRERWGFAPNDPDIASCIAAYHQNVEFTCQVNQVSAGEMEPYEAWLFDVQRHAKGLLRCLNYEGIERDLGDPILTTFVGGLAYGPHWEDQVQSDQPEPPPPNGSTPDFWVGCRVGHQFIRMLQDLADNPRYATHSIAEMQRQTDQPIPPLPFVPTVRVDTEKVRTREEAEWAAFDLLLYQLAQAITTRSKYKAMIELFQLYSIPFERIHKERSQKQGRGGKGGILGWMRRQVTEMKKVIPPGATDDQALEAMAKKLGLTIERSESL